MGPLEVESVQAPKFASLYVHDPTLEGVARKNNLSLPKDTLPTERRIVEEVLLELQEELKEHNPYIRDFLQICKIPEKEIQEATFVITEKQKPNNAGTRTYTSHHLTEVSVMMPEEVGSRDIVVNRRSGGVQEFKDTNRAAGPLHFVQQHSKGHAGWSPDQIRFAEEDGDYEARRLTCNKNYRYRLQSRLGDTNHYLLA